MASENSPAESIEKAGSVALEAHSDALNTECPCETHPNDPNCCCKDNNSGEKQDSAITNHHHHHHHHETNNAPLNQKDAPILQPFPPQYPPYVPQNGNCPQQCFCLVPVPSGLPHAPFVYQCVPISNPMGGSIPMAPMQGCPVPPSVSPPVQMLSPALSATNVPPPTLPPQVNSSPQKHVETANLDHIATTLTQMRTSGASSSCCAPCQPAQSSGTKDCKPVGGVSKNKPRSHACNWRDTWGYTCQRTFTRPYDLLRHQETVHCSDTKSYCCEYCGCTSKKFSRQDSLARHIRRMHQNVAPTASTPAPKDSTTTPEPKTQTMPSTLVEAKPIAYSSIQSPQSLDGTTNNDHHEQSEPELPKTEPIMTAQAV